MIYIGHFSFQMKSDIRRERRGHFTCIVNGHDIDRAVASFATLIDNANREKHLFESGTSIFWESIVEMTNLPEAGVLSYLEQTSQNGTVTVGRSLPYPSGTGGHVYTSGKEDYDGSAATAEAFIVFR